MSRAKNFKIVRLVAGSIVFLCGAMFASGAAVDWSSLEAGEDYVLGELIVGYRTGGLEAAFSDASAERAAINAGIGAKSVSSFNFIRSEVVSIPKSISLPQAADYYRQHPGVRYVEPNYIYHAALEPDDPRYGELWGMERIRAPEAWDMTTGSSNFVMAVIDTGIQYDHEDLAGNMWVNPDEIPGNGIDDDGNGYIDDIYGWNCAGDDGDVYPRIAEESHGTHVAGTIGAVGDNAIGVAGVNWQLQIVSLRFLTESGSGTTADAVKAMEYVIDNNIQLSNNSWGGGGFSDALYDAIDQAGKTVNHLFVAAAGNDDNDNDANPSYPASYDLDNIVSVAAIDETESIEEPPELANFSNYGAETVDIAAPGVNILSTVPFDGYSAYRGTSMAAPHVAGAAAFLWGMQTDMSWRDVRDIIYAGARPSPALAGLVSTGAELDLAASVGNIAASVTLDRKAYRSDAVATVTVKDLGVPFPDTSPDGTNAVPINFELRDDGDLVKLQTDLQLTRIDDTSLFEGTVDFADPAIPAVDGDTAVFIYTNAAGPDIQASAPIDDTPPVMSDLTVENVDSDSALVSWLTDEPADSYVLYAEQPPLQGADEQGSAEYVEEPQMIDGTEQYVHRVEVEDLKSFTSYYIAARSADYAGNTNSIPSDVSSAVTKDYEMIITQGRFTVYENDMDSGVLDWTVGSASGSTCWEYGKPTYRPDSPYTGTNCWGTVLDDRYPSNVNAWVQSGWIEDVRLAPRIKFWSWHEIPLTESLEEGYYWDAGTIEVDYGEGWQNVTARSNIEATYVQGVSEWQQVVVDLEGLFSNSNMRVRFRLESDSWIQGAGWMIDDFEVTHQLPPGPVLVLDYEIDDSDGGDGDGYPEPGESFYFDFELFNADVNGFYTNCYAEVSLPDEKAALLKGETVTYGDIAPGETLRSGRQVQIHLSETIAVGTRVSLFHTLYSDAGELEQQVVEFRVEDRESVSGKISDTLGSPIEDADVWAMDSSSNTLQAVSVADGSYDLHGFAGGETYSLWAGKSGEYSESEPYDVVAPSPGEDLVLGKAYANVSPTNLVASLGQGETTSLPIALNNSAGTIAFDADLSFEYGDAVEPDWVTFTPSNTTVAAGASGVLQVQLDAGELPVGTYEGLVVIDGNDISGEPVEVPLELTVTAGAVLDLVGVEVIDPDGDGFLEQGEAVSLNLELQNTGDASSGVVTGILSSATNFVNITSSEAIWFSIAGGTSSGSVTDPALQAENWLQDGDVVPFTLDVVNRGGAAYQFNFALTSSVRHTVSGTVTDGGGVQGAVIDITSSDGSSSFQRTTDADGDYTCHGLVPGEYDVFCTPPPPYKTPPAQNINLTADAVVDFSVADWGIGVIPTNIVAVIDEGRVVATNLVVNNTGPSDGQVVVEVELKRGIGPQDLPAKPQVAVEWDALQPGDYAPGRLIIAFENDADRNDKANVLGTYGLSEVKRLPAINASVVELATAASLEQTASRIADEPSVRYVEPDYLMQLFKAPDDARYNKLYGMNNERQTGGTKGADINAEQAWNVTVGDTNVVVGVFDTGVYDMHEDLIGNLVPGKSFAGDGLGNIDFAGHGTHVAGTIAAVGNNNLGVAGVSWQSKIMPCRIFSLFGMGTNTPVSAAIQALEHSVTNGVKISNNSWGGLYFSSALYDAIEHAYTNDHVLVCAAGNSGWDNDVRPHYPSSYDLPNVISVAATDDNDLLAEFSCYGVESVDIAAPGVDILSTVPEYTLSGKEQHPSAGSYASMNGTSMAAPHVSGVVALLRSVAPWATADMIRTAVLEGSRYDPELKGVVASAGHLDARGALDVLAASWLEVDPLQAVVPASGSHAFDVILNAGGYLTAGEYEAEIVVKQGHNSVKVPVSLTVNPAPMPEVELVEVAGGDGDPHAEPGETIDLDVTILNNGFVNLSTPEGVLSSSTLGVTITADTASWGTIANGETGTRSFTIQLGAGVPNEVDFTLTLSDGNREPWELQFSIDVGDFGSITGDVADVVGNGVPNAVVEYWGTSAGSTITAADGSYRIDSLDPTGSYTLRVLSDGFGTSGHQDVNLGGSDTVQDFTLLQPAVTFSTSRVEAAIQWPLSDTVAATISNAASEQFSFDYFEMPKLKAALIFDGAAKGQLEQELAGMGIDVDVYTNNYEIVSQPYLTDYGLYYNLEKTVNYSGDDTIVFTHDLVILDVSGLNGGGRLIQNDERAVLADYLDRGGRLIVTGGNPLSKPDNDNLIELAGVESADLASSTSSFATASNAIPTNVYVEVAVGDNLGTESIRYDLATPETNTATTVFFNAGASSKLLRREVQDGGNLYYWAGNYGLADWSARGVWIDVVKDILISEFATDLDWVDAYAPKTDLANESVPLTLVFNDSGDTDFGEYTGCILLKGNYPGQDDQFIDVQLEMVEPAIRVKSSTGVIDWKGDPLPGDGGDGSSVYQVIWAGLDGEIAPPVEGGHPTGDDVLLGAYPGEQKFGRFGKGYPVNPNEGLFSQRFQHELRPTLANRSIYVRAWDSPAPATAVAYGNSDLYQIQNDALETKDFGTWVVDHVIGYPGYGAKDTNDDSVPDGWYVKNGMDARNPIGPLANSAESVSSFGEYGDGPGQLDWPRRIDLTEDLVFVLDTGNNRIQVWDRENETLLQTYSPASAFGQPYGMAIDPRAGFNRLAVADTANNRVCLFNFDPATGQISAGATFGSYGTGDGQFNGPRAVAIGNEGNIFVADTDNVRIQKFNAAGSFLSKFTLAGPKVPSPEGLTVDADGLIWVADRENDRIVVYGSSGAVLGQFDGSGSGDEFLNPTDVRIGFNGNIFVMDKSNNRVQIFRRDGLAFVHIFTFGSLGEEMGEFKQPYGLMPGVSESVVYVADTFNNRVQKLAIELDGDGDGMDDLWESQNGLDPTDPADALLDPDGDGILNIGEFRIKTDPQNRDSDGDGQGDGFEIWHGLSPQDPEWDRLRITHYEFVPPNLRILFVVQSNRQYAVESTTDLEVGWTEEPGSGFTAAENGVRTNISPVVEHEFFRPVRK